MSINANTTTANVLNKAESLLILLNTFNGWISETSKGLARTPPRLTQLWRLGSRLACALLTSSHSPALFTNLQSPMSKPQTSPPDPNAQISSPVPITYIIPNAFLLTAFYTALFCTYPRIYHGSSSASLVENKVRIALYSSSAAEQHLLYATKEFQKCADSTKRQSAPKNCELLHVIILKVIEGDPRLKELQLGKREGSTEAFTRLTDPLSNPLSDEHSNTASPLSKTTPPLRATIHQTLFDGNFAKQCTSPSVQKCSYQFLGSFNEPKPIRGDYSSSLSYPAAFKLAESTANDKGQSSTESATNCVSTYSSH
ncbi:hypothetical protein VTL71DRAFT_9443 [Oculimacula yallundae]|uniref:Uncharacterized protein n=1 Tax=Oculimacula yallundae TaxID=86028 RepID=A0ABR4BUP8_9HELO